MRILNYVKGLDLDQPMQITLRNLFHLINDLLAVVNKTLVIKPRTDKDDSSPARLYWKVGDDQGTAYLTVDDDTQPLDLVEDLIHEGLHGKVTIGDEETPVRIAAKSIRRRFTPDNSH